MINKNDSLGIPNYGIWYLETLPAQDKMQEFMQIHSFINSVVNSNTVPEFQGREKRLEFINYGRTQLVYVLTIDEKRQYTLLVNQPATEYGTGKREYEDLQLLSKPNKENVVNPLYYFTDKNKCRELYITPYHYQSRCIGIDESNWGMWIPEPEYHFEDFSDTQKEVINSSMVAMLIKLYDDRRNCGLSECRLDGGDFMLEKDFEDFEMNYNNILNRIKLIAARKLITVDLDEYIYRMKKELSSNISKDTEKIVIGKKLKQPLSEKEIEKGIELGLELRNKGREK